MNDNDEHRVTRSDDKRLKKTLDLPINAPPMVPVNGVNDVRLMIIVLFEIFFVKAMILRNVVSCR